MGFPFLETSCSAVCRYETVITIAYFYIWHIDKTRFICFFSVTLQSLIFLRWNALNILPPPLTISYGLITANISEFFCIWFVYGRFWWRASKKCFIHSLANIFLDSDLLLWLDQFSRLHFLVFFMLLPLLSAFIGSSFSFRFKDLFLIVLFIFPFSTSSLIFLITL